MSNYSFNWPQLLVIAAGIHSRKRENYCGNTILEIQLLHLLMLMSTYSWYLILPVHLTGRENAHIKENLNIQMVIYTFFLDVSRLICVCSSSGSVCLLRVNLEINRETSQLGIDVQEFARLDLQGDIFSSPVMIGGRIFVGCRNDYVHCIVVEIQSLLQS